MATSRIVVITTTDYEYFPGAKVKNLKRVTKVKVVVWDVSFKKSYCTTG